MLFYQSFFTILLIFLSACSTVKKDRSVSSFCDNTKVTIQDGVAVKIESDSEFNQEWVWPSKSSEVEEASDSINIVNTLGSNILAARDGEVSFVGEDIHGVNFVILKHNHKTFSRYKGFEEINVCKSDIVRANSVLGKQGLNKDGKPILNFIIIEGRNKLNPLDFLPKK